MGVFKDPTEKKGDIFRFRVNYQMLRQLEALAKQRKIHVSELIRQLIDDEIKRVK